MKIIIKALSVNEAWAGRRFKSKKYKQYEIDVCKLLKVGKPVMGEVEVSYKFFIKNYGNTDVDNLIKPIQDIIVKREYIEDDRKIVRLKAEKIKSKEERIEIEIKKVEE